MPSKTWSAKVATNSGSALTLSYDAIEISSDGASARIKDAKITFASKSGWSDSNNSITAQGTAVEDALVHSGTLNGGTRTWPVTGTWTALSYGKVTPVSFDAKVYGISFFNGDQDTTVYSLPVDLPARAYELPNPPPAATVTRVSDTEHRIDWTTNYTASTGARPWQSVEVERWDNVSGAWARIITVGWDTTSYSDTTTRPDREFRYRVRAINPSGASPGTAASPTSVWTTPLAHSGLSWVKDGADVVLSWTRASTLGNVQTEIQESTDGGTTWGSALATTAAGATSWRHTSPSTATTHRYRVRPVIGGRSGAWILSTVVQLLAAPLAPTKLTPASVTVDPADPIAGAWQHNAVDGTAQTAFEVRWRKAGTTTWTTSTGTTGLVTWPAGTIARGDSIEWQVRTKGDHVDWSPWSDFVQFATGAKPTATIQSPGTTHETASVTIAWVYYDAESTPQVRAQVELVQAGNVIWTTTVLGTNSTVAAPHVENGRTYTARVRVLDGSGLWSSWASRTFTTTFTPPPAPEAVVSWDDELGVALIEITNPGGTIPAVSNRLWRSIDGGPWRLIAESVPVNGSVIDRAPASAGTNKYRVTSVSASDTTADTIVSLVTSSCWIWLAGGPGLDQIARCKGDATIVGQRGRPKVLHTFVGDAHPTEFAALTARTGTYQVTGKVAARARDDQRVALWDTWPAWEAIAGVPAPLLFRDPLGRRHWVSISSDVSINHTAGDNFAVVSATVTVIQHDE